MRTYGSYRGIVYLCMDHPVDETCFVALKAALQCWHMRSVYTVQKFLDTSRQK